MEDSEELTEEGLLRWDMDAHWLGDERIHFPSALCAYLSPFMAMPDCTGRAWSQPNKGMEAIIKPAPKFGMGGAHRLILEQNFSV